MTAPDARRAFQGVVALATALSPFLGAQAAERLEAAFDLPDPSAAQTLTLEAEELVWERRAERVRALGDVRLGLDALTLRAPLVVLDLAAGRLSAEGGVETVEGDRRLLAERLTLALDGSEAVAERAQLELLADGRRRLRLSADRLLRDEAGRFDAWRVVFTPCDCGPDRRPSWSLSARRAQVRPERGAWLWWPTLRILDVPVLPLPLFYVPLGERRTGLLAPRVGWSGRRGLELAEPLFLALDRSWDATLTPKVSLGREPEKVVGRGGAPVRPGVRGPRLGAELRYAPARRTGGRLWGEWVYDTHRLDDPGDPDARRGHRGRLSWRHASRFDDGGFGVPGHGLWADVELVGDAALVADLAARLERQEVGYLRSVARAQATFAPRVSAEVGGLYLQDLRRPLDGDLGYLRARQLFGHADAGVPVTFQQLPSLHVASAPMPVVGRLFGRLGAHLVAWQLPSASFDDAGSDGLLRGDIGWCDETAAGCEASGEGDGLLGPGEQSPVLHARVDADLSHPFHLGRAIAGRAMLGARVDTWSHSAAGEAPSRTGLRVVPVGVVELRSGLERRGEVFRHRLEPTLAWKWAPVAQATGTPAALDARDLAVGADGFHGAVVGLQSRLSASGGRRLDVGVRQGWSVAGWSPSDLAAEASATAGRGMVRVDGSGAWSWNDSLLTAASAGASLGRGEGGRLSARWVRVLPEASDWMRAGLEELFAAGAIPRSPLPRRIDELVASLSTPRLGGLRARYALRLDLGPQDVARPPQHAVAATFESRCECWSAGVSAVWLPDQRWPEVTLTLELSEIGSVRGGAALP